MSADGKTVTVEQGGASKVWNVTDSTAGVTIAMAADGGAEKELSGAAEPEEPGGGENTGGNGGGENTGGNGGSVGDNTGVVLKDDGSGRKDVFRGGSGADEIIGGEGNDEIVLGRNAPGAKIVLGGGDGHDRAEGFSFGFGEDANAVSLRGRVEASDVSVDRLGRLQVGNATLEFVGTDLNAAGEKPVELLLEDSGGMHKALIGREFHIGDDPADLYYGTGEGAEADFRGFHGTRLVVDLGNTGLYGGHVAAEFYNVKKARGADGIRNELIGADGENHTLVGGDHATNFLYGGRGGRDLLIGGRNSGDTFCFGAYFGDDTVEGFSEEDTLRFLGGHILGARTDRGTGLEIYWQDDAGRESRLILRGIPEDGAVAYDAGGGRHGAKFGASLTIADDTAGFVDYYNSCTRDGDGELLVSGNQKKSIWLDGSHGVSYEGFRTVDARNLSGDSELAGGAKDDILLAGAGNASLWGGIGGNDTMTGGSGYDEFYFGMGEGHDIITASDTGDKVMLYNVPLEKIASAGMEGSDMVIRLTDGSSLTLQDYGANGASTFRLADGTWSYDRTSGSWRQI